MLYLQLTVLYVRIPLILKNLWAETRKVKKFPQSQTANMYKKWNYNPSNPEPGFLTT